MYYVWAEASSDDGVEGEETLRGTFLFSPRNKGRHETNNRKEEEIGVYGNSVFVHGSRGRN